MKSFLFRITTRVFLLVAGTVLMASKTFAAGEFLVNYTVDYTVSEEGQTNVVQSIALVNKQTNLYAREYSIKIDSNRIKNISASDKKGAITPSVSSQDNKTEIRLAFNDEVVGQGNILYFQLKYEDENIAKKNGSIWEINIPGIAEDADLGDYTVQLHIPPSFGPAAYMVPEPESIYKWSKKNLINGGVSAAFGKEQVFDLTLSYFLENTKSTPIMTEIALPPSTAYQFITIESLTPQPETILTDSDGNWLARYRLEGQTNTIVQAKLSTQILLYPRTEHTDPVPSAVYREPTNYWQSGDGELVAIARELKTPRNIYEYVVKTLEYDYSRINKKEERKGAIQALKDPKSSVCMEFTDLFVALARAAGIPARQAVGFAYTTNAKLRPLSLVSDVLHAWPEYYDDQTNVWVPVDPTWGNTTGGVDYFEKLDFNHIVFAYNGAQDDYPYPAGFYRQAGRVGKDVDVRFREGALPPQSVALTTGFKFPSRIFAGFSTSGQAFIRNTGTTAAEHTLIHVESAEFGISTQLITPMVPPFGVVSIPFTVRPSNIFASGQKNITASVNGNSQQYSVTVIPLYYLMFPFSVVIVWIVLVFAILMKRKKHVQVQTTNP